MRNRRGCQTMRCAHGASILLAEGVEFQPPYWPHKFSIAKGAFALSSVPRSNPTTGELLISESSKRITHKLSIVRAVRQRKVLVAAVTLASAMLPLTLQRLCKSWNLNCSCRFSDTLRPHMLARKRLRIYEAPLTVFRCPNDIQRGIRICSRQTSSSYIKRHARQSSSAKGIPV